MKFDLASADANILGHLYRSASIELISLLFQQVLIDEWILGEIKHRQQEILPSIEQEMQQHSFLVLMDKTELQKRKLISVYNTQLQDMEQIFLPQDSGEKHAIALAQAAGARFLLTDDEKQDGPYWSIERGIITNLEVLAFWDLVFLNIIAGNFKSYHEAKATYYQICCKGYEPPYKAYFGSRMKMAVRHIKDKPWFKIWSYQNNVSPRDIIELLEVVKKNRW